MRKWIAICSFALPVVVFGGFLSFIPPEKTPPLPAASEIFTVAIYPGTHPQGHLFDTNSFLQTYAKLKPAKVNHALGIDRVWQNGVIVMTNRTVLFWRTCDKRFILVDSTNGPYSYAVQDVVDLDPQKTE